MIVPSELLDDLVELVGPRPVLFSDVVGALRHSMRSPLPKPSRRWKLYPEDVEEILRGLGCHFADRPYGTGLAVYVASDPFEEIRDARGTVRKVRAR